MEITYTPVKRGKEQTVVIEPHILTFYNGTWYVRGRSLTPGKRNPKHGDFLTFALHRISAARRQGKSFECNTKEISSVSEKGPFDFPKCVGVKLMVSGMALRQAVELLPIENQVDVDQDWTELTLKEIDDFKVINFVLVSEGRAQIREPEALREKTLKQAEETLRCLKLPSWDCGGGRTKML